MTTGLSLHIGLNRVDPAHYAGWSGPLNACEADAEDMQAIAKTIGYNSQSLLTAQATRDAVLSGITKAASRLSAGDRVLVLSDSCHSGTVTRQQYNELVRSGVVRQPVTRSDGHLDPVFRVMPDDVAMSTYRKNKPFYQQLAKTLPAKPSAVKATVRLISGCQDNQLSMDGTFNGLFTATLLRVWNDGAFQGNYRRFHQAIVRLMPPTQSPNHLMVGAANTRYDEQSPFSI